MMQTRRCRFIGLLFLGWTLAGYADNGIQPAGKVCPNPATPGRPDNYTLQPYEISANLTKELAWMTADHSLPFHAILLRSIKAIPAKDSTDECWGYSSEQERIKVQAIFPQRKAFASRNGCFGPGRAYKFQHEVQFPRRVWWWHA